MVARQAGERPGLVGELQDAGYVRLQRDGTWLVPSPTLLDHALRLGRAGVDVELTGRMRDLLRRRLSKAVDDTVKLFAERTGAGFAGAATPEELATARRRAAADRSRDDQRDPGPGSRARPRRARAVRSAAVASKLPSVNAAPRKHRSCRGVRPDHRRIARRERLRTTVDRTAARRCRPCPPPRSSTSSTVVSSTSSASAAARSAGRFAGAPMILVNHVGAKSGTDVHGAARLHHDGDSFVVIASKGGSPEHPQWFHNLVANPDVTVEVGTETIPVRARVAEGDERARLFRAQADRMPNFDQYAARDAAGDPGRRVRTPLTDGDRCASSSSAPVRSAAPSPCGWPTPASTSRSLPAGHTWRRSERDGLELRDPGGSRVARLRAVGRPDEVDVGRRPRRAARRQEPGHTGRPRPARRRGTRRAAGRLRAERRDERARRTAALLQRARRRRDVSRRCTCDRVSSSPTRTRSPGSSTSAASRPGTTTRRWRSPPRCGEPVSNRRPIDDLPRWRWAKLVTNLGNAVEAVCGPAARSGPLGELVTDEGHAVLAAAGIDHATPEEDRRRRGDLLSLHPVGGERRPGGSTWQSIARGMAPETDLLNGEIVRAGPTPRRGRPGQRAAATAGAPARPRRRGARIGAGGRRPGGVGRSGQVVGRWMARLVEHHLATARHDEHGRQSEAVVTHVLAELDAALRAGRRPSTWMSSHIIEIWWC